MCQKTAYLGIQFSKNSWGACPQIPLEACVPVILGMVDSLAGPSPLPALL